MNKVKNLTSFVVSLNLIDILDVIYYKIKLKRNVLLVMPHSPWSNKIDYGSGKYFMTLSLMKFYTFKLFSFKKYLRISLTQSLGTIGVCPWIKCYWKLLLPLIVTTFSWFKSIFLNKQLTHIKMILTYSKFLLNYHRINK